MDTVLIKRGQLRAWSDQPRKRFPKDKQEELTESMRELGQLQPLLVRPIPEEQRAPDGPTHEIIAGERRWRSSEPAGIAELACVVRDLSDKEAIRIAVTENTHRDDLDQVEEASGYQRMVNLGWTIKEIEGFTGKSGGVIRALIDLLDLDKATLKELQDGTISRDTARTLGRVDDPEARQEALKTVVNVGGRPLAEKAAKEVIQMKYIVPQRRQERWEKAERQLRKEWPTAEIVSVTEAWRYFGTSVPWVRWADRPAEIDLAVHMRGQVVPTWGELAAKHKGKVVIVPDDEGNAVPMVEREPLIAAEQALGEEDPAKCIFPMSGRGRHVQSVARQQNVVEEKKRQKQQQDDGRRRKGDVLRHLQADLLRGPGLTWDRIEELTKLFFDDFAQGLDQVLELIGVDAAAFSEDGTDAEAGARVWAEQKFTERAAIEDAGPEDVLLFLILSCSIGALWEHGEFFDGTMEKVERLLGVEAEPAAEGDEEE